MEDSTAWIGRTESVADEAAPGPLKRLSALLDHMDPPWPQREVPPLDHWLYFLPCARRSQIGPDGHSRRGDFLRRAICPGACGREAA